MVAKRKVMNRIVCFACRLTPACMWLELSAGGCDEQRVMGLGFLGETSPLIYRIDDIRSDLGMPRRSSISLFPSVFIFDSHSLAGVTSTLLIVYLPPVSKHEPIVSFSPQYVLFYYYYLSSLRCGPMLCTIITLILARVYYCHADRVHLYVVFIFFFFVIAF